LTAGACLARLPVVLWAWRRVPASADGFYYHRLAERLAAGHGYTWLWPDGAVTYAAHYPVGYPAWLAASYAVFGAQVEVAMVGNALGGALAVFFVHRILARFRRRGLAAVGACLVALHPALLMYTPAVMTEGWVATLLVASVWLVLRIREARGDRRRRAIAWCALGLCLAASSLVRPQCLLLAPMFGGLAALPAGSREVANRWRRAAMGGCLATALCLVLIAPWTLRNCERMGRCSLVSANGGWNLLIGTQAAGRGAWSPLVVPAACRSVFDEAEKDRCFMSAARQRITDEPGAWLRMAPAKLAATFDYGGAAGWYLHEAAPTLFTARHKWWLGIVETIYQRLLLACAWLASCRPARRRRERGRTPGASQLLLYAAAVLAVSPYAWLSVLLGTCGMLLRRPSIAGRPVVYGAFLAALLSVACVHVLFFGAGRYALPLLPLVAVLAALGAARLAAAFRGRVFRHPQV
jgi:4-amino-4-deoxy-L-arabinose transferase-like glycosyltransferase